ncbi:MAG: NADPH-dependent 7-cyano-7-deazaguanine reductase QueF [Pseudomonadota bacterium]|nr:NADPH-dependent 7-cyano-7-deazaguanine reductase QueF [Pseudomonadota bacterium]
MTDLTKITELGKETNYKNNYDPSLLISVPRAKSKILQHGFDVWRSWETSWLNNYNKPQIATIILFYSAKSPYIVESKSLKLYLGSLNFTNFSSEADLINTIERDVSFTVGSKVIVKLDNDFICRAKAPGVNIDNEDIDIIAQRPTPELLKLDEKYCHISETLHTNLFRSCCPVTAQPDWATIVVRYSGLAINHKSLLQYLLAFRNHSGFHESCVSEIFTDIKSSCDPEKLEVQGFFTRRGGIDINPLRSSDMNCQWDHIYLPRQ